MFVKTQNFTIAQTVSRKLEKKNEDMCVANNESTSYPKTLKQKNKSRFANRTNGRFFCLFNDILPDEI